MRVLFITNVPSPYRVRFFNHLARYCELTVVYEKEKSDERDVKWTEKAQDNYRSVFLKGIRTAVDGAFAPGVVKWLNKDMFDIIVICGISSPTEMLAIQWCQICGVPYCVEGDGAFAKDGKGFREKLKRHLIKKSSLCFSTGRMHDAYFRQYGAAENTLVRYPFTSVAAADVLDHPMDREQKVLVRQKIGMTEGHVLLSVGQFIYRKGFDVLLEAARQLPKDTGIYIVGGEPTEEYLDLKRNHQLDNVHFVGFLPKKELSLYYMASDAFVLPTREDIWGLVVNEAMAYGLPVITTTRCNAGLELVENGVNGYLVEVEDVQALAQAMNSIIAADMRKFGQAALQTIRGYTLEEMAKRHSEIFDMYWRERKV